MKQTYELKTIDGKLFVSVRELMEDIKDALDKISDLNDPRMIEVDQRELDTKVIGLHAIYTFLGALCTEQELIDKAEELKRQPLLGDINIKTVNFNPNIDVLKDNGETLH